MLFSMTGFGQARNSTPDGSMACEVRSVNNRHLKVVVRGSEPYPVLEAEVERIARRYVKRGTLQVQVHAERGPATVHNRLNMGVLKSYIEQILNDLKGVPAAERAALMSGLLQLPGIAPDEVASAVSDSEWSVFEKTLEASLVKLNVSRQLEGDAMATELLQLSRAIADYLGQISDHIPGVAVAYRKRMLERVQAAIAESDVQVAPEHLIREVAIFADRIDVAEELIRLRGHLAAFEEIVQGDQDSPGRRLEFVVQEMAREANTLGSKAGDVAISRLVVEIKASLERMRELVQNIE